MVPWLVLGCSDHRIPSRSRLMRDFIFLLAPPNFSVHLVAAVKPAQKGEMMSEKTPKAKTQEDRPVRKSTRASKKENRKDEAVEPIKAKPRSKAPIKQPIREKVEETPQTSGNLMTFRLNAPQAIEVCVAGCFNGWRPQASPLKRNQEGVWTCTMSIEPGEHQYRFIVDGEWRDDPLNSSRCWNEFGTENCMLIVEG
jgi:hypothetical protein